MSVNISSIGSTRPSAPAVRNRPASQSPDAAPAAGDLIELSGARPASVAGQGEQQKALAQLVIAPALDPLTRQVLMSDLGQFPTPWLKFLGDYGVKVVAMQDGQNLTDTAVMAKYAIADMPAAMHEAQASLYPILANNSAPEGEMASYYRGQLEEAAQEKLQDGPFRLAVHNEPFDLNEIAARRDVPAERVGEWKQLFEAANEPWAGALPDGRWTSSHGLVLFPPVPTEYGAVPEQKFQAAHATTGEHVAASLGLNQGAEQLVLLHERYLPMGAPEIGDYRVAIHEVGHALDYALEGLPAETGFGPNHKAHLKDLFEHDKQRAAAGEKAFTSDRASDNVREYFAEGVEAYLTTPSSNDFRPDNHREALRERNPGLYALVDGIFTSQPGAEWVSQPPKPQGLPPGFPDPDRDAIHLD